MQSLGGEGCQLTVQPFDPKQPVARSQPHRLRRRVRTHRSHTHPNNLRVAVDGFPRSQCETQVGHVDLRLTHGHKCARGNRPQLRHRPLCRRGGAVGQTPWRRQGREGERVRWGRACCCRRGETLRAGVRRVRVIERLDQRGGERAKGRVGADGVRVSQCIHDLLSISEPLVVTGGEGERARLVVHALHEREDGVERGVANVAQLALGNAHLRCRYQQVHARHRDRHYHHVRGDHDGNVPVGETAQKVARLPRKQPAAEFAPTRPAAKFATHLHDK